MQTEAVIYDNEVFSQICCPIVFIKRLSWFSHCFCPVTHACRACERSVSGAGRISGGAGVVKNDGAGAERGTGTQREVG